MFMHLPRGLMHLPRGVMHLPRGLMHLPRGMTQIPRGNHVCGVKLVVFETVSDVTAAVGVVTMNNALSVPPTTRYGIYFT